MTISQTTINQYITNIQVQQLLTFAATKVQFAATASHFSHFFSHQKPSNYMIINTKNFNFMHFSATATHFGAPKTTQSPHNQACHHLQLLLSFSLFQLQIFLLIIFNNLLLFRNIVNINPITFYQPIHHIDFISYCNFANKES
jgi:hypothetical protein